MALAPVAYIAPNYRDYKSYWLKFYVPSTTTPKTMSTNESGDVLIIKAELNKDGFPVTAGGAIFIPYVDGNYDAFLFRTEQEADDNETSSAVRVADNISAGGDSNGIFVDAKSETVTLINGQTLVELSSVDANASALYIGNGVTDRGRLIKDVDYEILDSFNVELYESYPEGTTLQVIQGAESIPTSNSESLTFYVSNSGSDNNDGLTESTPFLTIQKAADTMLQFGDIFPGTYLIKLAAGTYDRVRFNDEGMGIKGVITIEGPDVGGHPNVPTAIISEGSNVIAEGVKLSNNTNVKLKDVKIAGFNGSVSSAGFSGGNRCNMFTENAHFDNCYIGASNTEWGELDLKGGIYENCGFLNGVTQGGYATRLLFSSKSSIGTQNQGDLTLGPIFKNNYIAVFAQEGVNGHVDYCTFEDNDIGIRASVLSRLNCDGSSFKRNLSAIWYTENSVISIFDSTEFGSVADVNYNPLICDRGSVLPLNSMTTTNDPLGSSERTVYREIVNQTVNNTSALTVYQMTLKGGLWVGNNASVSPMRRIRYKMYGQLNGTNGFKRAQFRFGATPNNITFLAAETGDFEVEGFILIGDNPQGTQLQRITGFNHLGNPRTSSVTSNEAMTADTNFNIEALVENAADNIFIESIEVYVDGI